MTRLFDLMGRGEGGWIRGINCLLQVKYNTFAIVHYWGQRRKRSKGSCPFSPIILVTRPLTQHPVRALTHGSYQVLRIRLVVKVYMSCTHALYIYLYLKL